MNCLFFLQLQEFLSLKNPVKTVTFSENPDKITVFGHGLDIVLEKKGDDWFSGDYKALPNTVELISKYLKEIKAAEQLQSQEKLHIMTPKLLFVFSYYFTLQNLLFFVERITPVIRIKHFVNLISVRFSYKEHNYACKNNKKRKSKLTEILQERLQDFFAIRKICL